jgi:hypothetical protein
VAIPYCYSYICQLLISIYFSYIKFLQRNESSEPISLAMAATNVAHGHPAQQSSYVHVLRYRYNTACYVLDKRPESSYCYVISMRHRRVQLHVKRAFFTMHTARWPSLCRLRWPHREGAQLEEQRRAIVRGVLRALDTSHKPNNH